MYCETIVKAKMNFKAWWSVQVAVAHWYLPSELEMLFLPTVQQHTLEND
jgi:hypothetical protein